MRFGESKTKQIASIDISKECGENKMYYENYVNSEHLVHDLLKLDNSYIPLNV